MKSLLLAMTIMAGLADAGLARTVEERLIAGLRDQGYVILEDGYTFLGRLRIVAESDRYHREIVVNPGTGEVLRDYVVERRDLLPNRPAESDSNSASGATIAGTATDPGIGTATDGADIAAMATISRLGTGTETGADGIQGADTAPDMILADPALSAGQEAP